MTWCLRLICCGRDDGFMHFETWAEAQAFRDSYTSPDSGHERSAVLTKLDLELTEPNGGNT